MVALKKIFPKTPYFAIAVTLALILLVGFYLILIGYTYFHYNPASLFELIATPEISHAIVLSLLWPD